jgi:hypothetical protein
VLPVAGDQPAAGETSGTDSCQLPEGFFSVWTCHFSSGL